MSCLRRIWRWLTEPKQRGYKTGDERSYVRMMTIFPGFEGLGMRDDEREMRGMEPQYGPYERYFFQPAGR